MHLDWMYKWCITVRLLYVYNTGNATIANKQSCGPWQMRTVGNLPGNVGQQEGKAGVEKRRGKHTRCGESG